MSVTITVTGLDKALRRMDTASWHGPLRAAMQDSVLWLEKHAKLVMPVNTGQGRASISSSVEGSGLDLVGRVGSNLVQVSVAETGARPHWPPFQPILRWVQLKLRPPKKMEYVVARGVQRAIARRGIIVPEGTGIYTVAWQSNAGRIYQRFEQALTQAMEGP